MPSPEQSRSLFGRCPARTAWAKSVRLMFWPSYHALPIPPLLIHKHGPVLLSSCQTILSEFCSASCPFHNPTSASNNNHPSSSASVTHFLTQHSIKWSVAHDRHRYRLINLTSHNVIHILQGSTSSLHPSLSVQRPTNQPPTCNLVSSHDSGHAIDKAHISMCRLAF